MPDQRDPDPGVRRAQRVLLMVHELHKLGYQRLRIFPAMSSSFMHWRCTVTHIGNILKTHGAFPKDFDRDVARYTSADANVYFGWEDARQDTARQLAQKFLARFPDLVAKGLGVDWLYAGWYVQMLGFAERGDFPVSDADWPDRPTSQFLPTTRGFDSGLPMPPGGEADPQKPDAGT